MSSPSADPNFNLNVRILIQGHCAVIVILSFVCTRNGFLLTDFLQVKQNFCKVQMRSKLTDFAPFLLFPSILK